jgi:hypothetical protein
MLLNLRFHAEFESYLRSQFFNGLSLAALCLRSVCAENKLCELPTRGIHRIIKDCAVNVHCGADIGVPHHLLLLSRYRRSHHIQPSAMRMPE